MIEGEFPIEDPRPGVRLGGGGGRGSCLLTFDMIPKGERTWDLGHHWRGADLGLGGNLSQDHQLE
jgi:hypothetical protein